MSMRRGLIGLVGLGMCCVGAVAIADVTVTGDEGAWIHPSNYTIEWDINHEWATVTLKNRYQSGISWFEVHGSMEDGEGMRIAEINITVNTDNNPGTAIGVRVLEDEAGGIKDVGSIYRVGSENTLINQIAITGPLGYVEADAIGDIVVDGDINGPLVANGDDSTPKINSVWSRNGNIYANMIVADRPDTVDEFIGSINAPNGQIGTGPNARVILHSAGHIGQIEAQSIYADITSTGSGVEGRLYGLKATAGPFVGSINVLNLQNFPTNNPSEYSCVGTMDADITASAGNLGEPLIITGGDFPLKSHALGHQPL